eukprot:GHVS01001713.1.p1 GENE.GHVS01001713.1~~GHVS01001713.1.p1  ORF type:complete len:310 (+),score=13.85 GHVS01001713.1:689-1618(+)
MDRLGRQATVETDVVFVRSNRGAANIPGFLDTLMEHMIPKHQELGWQHIRDQILAQQMFKGLKQMVDSNATGCAMRFLFDPSPGMREASEHTVNRNFLIRPFGDCCSSPAFRYILERPPHGRLLRTPAKSFIEHLADEGIALSTKTGRAVKHVGVHVRLVPHGPGEAFSDHGHARLSREESAGAIDCAKDLVALERDRSCLLRCVRQPLRQTRLPTTVWRSRSNGRRRGYAACGKGEGDTSRRKRGATWRRAGHGCSCSGAPCGQWVHPRCSRSLCVGSRRRSCTNQVWIWENGQIHGFGAEQCHIEIC